MSATAAAASTALSKGVNDRRPKPTPAEASAVTPAVAVQKANVIPTGRSSVTR